MSWFTSIFSSGVDKVVDSVANGLDKLFTSDEERLAFKNKLQAEMNNFKLEMESKANEYEQEVTKRWTKDSEHFITRLVRPLSYIFVLALFAIMVLFDGNVGDISIKEAYAPIIETLLVTMTVSYFGGRSFEKIKRMVS